MLIPYSYNVATRYNSVAVPSPNVSAKLSIEGTSAAFTAKVRELRPALALQLQEPMRFAAGSRF